RTRTGTTRSRTWWATSTRAPRPAFRRRLARSCGASRAAIRSTAARARRAAPSRSPGPPCWSMSRRGLWPSAPERAVRAPPPPRRGVRVRSSLGPHPVTRAEHGAHGRFASRAAASGRPRAPDARRPRGQVERGVGGRRRLSLRSLGAARARVLDRHPTADGQRLAPCRTRLLLHAHRRGRPLPADAWHGGLLPDGLGRQRPADRAARAESLRRALRSVSAL